MEYILEVLCVANEKKLPRVKIKTKGKLTRKTFSKRNGCLLCNKLPSIEEQTGKMFQVTFCAYFFLLLKGS